MFLEQAVEVYTFGRRFFKMEQALTADSESIGRAFGHVRAGGTSVPRLSTIGVKCDHCGLINLRTVRRSLVLAARTLARHELWKCVAFTGLKVGGLTRARQLSHRCQIVGDSTKNEGRTISHILLETPVP